VARLIGGDVCSIAAPGAADAEEDKTPLKGSAEYEFSQTFSL